MSDHTTTESTIQFSGTRTVNGKQMRVYFTRSEQAAKDFANRFSKFGSHYYRFIGDLYRVII